MNSNLFDAPLDESEVGKITRSVWKYKETGKLWVGGEARAVLSASELKSLNGQGDAALLLMTLRAAHGWRDGGEFILANALAATFQWSIPRLRKARDFLIQTKFMEITHRGGSGPHDPPRARLIR